MYILNQPLCNMYTFINILLQSTDPMLIPLDPRVLRDLEKQARKIASNLEYIMDNLHNSLHAVSHTITVLFQLILS